MLATVFYFLLNMSLAAILVIAVLMLIRLIKPLPRRLVYPLWALALLRLVIPFALPASFSVFNLTGRLVRRLVVVPGASPDLSVMNMIGAAEQYAPVTFKTETLRQVFAVASLVWVIGAAAGLLTALILYGLARAELRKAEPVRDNLFSSAMVVSPVLTGVLRPRIILPPGLDPDGAEGRMILAHETTHARRLDNLWRGLAIATACLHWFNPVVWLALKAFLADMELSCDEAVIRRYDPAGRRAYATTLLSFAESRTTLVATAFGHSAVKVRIGSVLNFRRLTTLGTVASGLFLAIVTIALITNPHL